MKLHKHIATTFARALIIGLLLAAQSWAQTWIGNAAAVKQISTITASNTWAAGDDAIVTINGKALTVDIGTAVTTADVAEAIADAFNASTRLDGTGTPDATSNFGGQEFGEFAEVTASNSGSVVTLIGNTAGKPFTFAVSEVTAGDGVLASATTQTATGPNFWDNSKNWDTGVVPANDGTVVFRDSSVPVKYGLPNGALEVTFHVYMSYSGTIGLPAVNADNQSKPYSEYRQRYVRLDDAGTGTDIAHRFGIGSSGIGCTLCNLKHSTVKCSPIVYNTGTAQISGTKSLNICCTATTSTINILSGSVDFSSQDGSSSAFSVITQTGGDSRGIDSYAINADFDVRGGTMLVGGSAAMDSMIVGPGTVRIESQTGTIADMGVSNAGIIDYASTGTVTQLIIYSGGTFDARSGAGGFNIANTLMYGGSLIDPYARINFVNAGTMYFDISQSLQLGGSPGTAISFDR